MEVDTSWLEISQAELFESEDEDIFAKIDLSTYSDPLPGLIHLDCGKDCSNYDDWTSEKCFTNVFPVDEVCLHDPELLNDVFRAAKQQILEMKMLGQDQLGMRLSVTNLLHFVHSEKDTLNGNGASGLEMIKSLLDNKKFAPSVQDGRQYIHGYFEWKLILALISMNTDAAPEAIKKLAVDLVTHSINRIGDIELRQVSPFPCKCFEGLWSIIAIMTEKMPSEFNIWTLLELSINSSETAGNVGNRSKGRKYRDISLTYLWFLRYFPKCLQEDSEAKSQYSEVVSRSFATFLEKDPPESDLRSALYDLKMISKTNQLNVDSLILLWEYLYKKINSNFKTINLDSANSLLVPNDTALSYLNKITAMVNNVDEENPNLTSYDLFLEMLIRGWRKAGEENDLKFQQKLSNRLLMKFSSKMWLSMNEMGIHNLVNLLLIFYHLSDDRTLDRIENILLSLPFAEITHNRRVAVFKGLTAVLVMFYGKSQERKSKSYPENYVKKFENSVGVDRFTGRQLVCAIDTIFLSSESLNNKEFVLIHPWMKLYLNTCTDNDRDVLLETLIRIMEKYNRMKANNVATEEGEEVIKRIYQSLEGNIMGYLNAEQEVDISQFVANLFVSLQQPIQGVPLVDNLFTTIVLNNIRNPRLQLKIVTRLSEISNSQSAIHVNNLVKAFLKFMLIIEGPVMDLHPILCLFNESKEFKSFCNMDCDEFLNSPQPFAVFLKGIRSTFELLLTDADRDRFYNRLDMYFQMYTKWYLPHMSTAEGAAKCYANTTAVIFICGKIIYTKRSPNLLKSLITDFFLTSALLGKKAQPTVVTKAVVKIMHSLLGGLFQLESSANDEYLSSVISDLIFHWTPQFISELNVSGAVVPFIKFAKANYHNHLAEVLFDRFSKSLLSPQSQRDILAMKMLREILTQAKGDSQLLNVLLKGSLLRILEYYCKSEDFAPVKKSILDYLEEISTLNFIAENMEVSRLLDDVFEKWTLSTLHSPNYFELAIKLARMFPVNLRTVMPKVRAEITSRSGGAFAAGDRLQQKLRNLEMILQQK